MQGIGLSIYQSIYIFIYLVVGAKLLSRMLDLHAASQGEMNCIRGELVENRKSVITLQQQLVDAKDGQLQALQATVKESVSDSVKSEIQSYSDVLKAENPGQTIPLEKLKTVVKTALADQSAEDDRSLNFMLFGLEENTIRKGTCKDCFACRSCSLSQAPGGA